MRVVLEVIAGQKVVINLNNLLSYLHSRTICKTKGDDCMPRMGENIRKRKDGRYEGRYANGYKTDGTIKYRSVYGKTYAEVKQKLYEAVWGKTYVKSLPKSKLVVSQVAYMWLQSKNLYIKQSTYSHYLSVVENHINSNFKNTRITELTETMIQNFSAELMRKLRPKTVRDILTVLGQVLDYATGQGLCNKFSGKIRLPKDTASTMIILSPKDQQRLTTFLTLGLDLQKLGILICLFTGMRLGEICGLRWEDIDFTNGIIKVRRTIQRIGDERGGTRFLIDTPKTQKSIRDIPVPNFLMDYLHECKCGNLSTYVLTGTTQFTQPRTYQNRFKGYLRDSGLSEDFHFHTLRHTFASRAIELGFDPKTLSEILGHANVNITLNRYVHSSMELKRRNMELFQVVI